MVSSHIVSKKKEYEEMKKKMSFRKLIHLATKKHLTGDEAPELTDVSKAFCFNDKSCTTCYNKVTKQSFADFLLHGLMEVTEEELKEIVVQSKYH